MLKKWLTLGLLLNISTSFLYPHAVLGAEDQESLIDNYGVSSSHPLAVEVGMEVLENGGNAADAAVAVAYTLSVVEPYGSGIGGGGQLLLLPPEEMEPLVYDYWSSAPSDEEWGNKVSGVPGFVKGLDALHQDFGSEPFAKLISPAIELAENGFEIDYLLSERLIAATPRLPVEDLPHFYPGSKPIQPGETLKQLELAETLTQIKENGPDAFYKGEIGKQVTEAVSYLNETDLEDYQVRKPKPVKGELNEGTIYSASPSLAGLPIIQSLKIAEKVRIEEIKDNESEFTHVMTEILKLTSNERVRTVGDPAFNDIDFDELVSEEYIDKLAEQISSSNFSTTTVDDGEKVNDGNTDTTHFVIIDQDGMMISATNTLSNFFGSGTYTAGFFMNNSVEHFSTMSTSPNRYEPGKRGRSSAAPSIYIDNERVIGLGTPGGTRIPYVMTEVLTRHLLLDQTLEEAVDAARFYGQEDVLYVEEHFSEDVMVDLIKKGYQVQVRNHLVYFGGIQALELNLADHSINGIADIRRAGTWDAKDKRDTPLLLELGISLFFLLCIAFPVLHLFHCLPWFRSKGEEIQEGFTTEKGISILVPCYNEQGIIETSVNSMKSLSYSKFEVVYINDGSNDQTMVLLNEYLKLIPCTRIPYRKLSHTKVRNCYQSELYPHIYVVDKTNGGKADALNAGIEYSSQDVIVTLDADTILTDTALPAINKKFEDPNIVAAGGMVHILQTKTSRPLSRMSLLHTNLLVRLQMLDFLKAFYITKISLARFHALAIISGAFGIFRKQALLDVGGYRTTVGEDIDITLKMHRYISKRKNKKIILIPEAICYTELPETFKDFFKQRVRWQKAYIDCLIYFRSFFAKSLFSRAVSFFYIFEAFLAGTISAFIMLGIFVINAIYYPPESYTQYVFLYLVYLFLFSVVYDLVSIGMSRYYGFKFGKNDGFRLCTAIAIDVLVYRIVILYIVLYGSIAYFFNHDWNKVARTGRNYQTESKSKSAA
ncbi:gamma-glutamyltransferase [Halalkalibacter alkalisediminis]|uniref:Gamma-glutamyltransferase n=1 Tax=Halalkalibacter alkalisediminis TaxID=935616 RepID=A0ABV6NJU1_9BACI|nr:gamma-glutamyltransferase [Halalkalibacter alkalisediminis]